MRVVVLTQWFDPEPTFKGLVFARELVRQGCEVEVVTGFPNYPAGRLYDGYRLRWLQREEIDGVRINRVPLFPSHSNSKIGRVANYLSFAASALFYCLFVMRRADVDVLYAYHPPLTTGIVAAIIRIVRRIPVVYDIQDIWPDTLRATGMLNNKKALRLIAAFCRWVYRRVDKITVLSPGFKRLLLERSVPYEKVEVIYNWADEASLTSHDGELPDGFPTEGGIRIVFAGNMGSAQALTHVLDAAELLQKQGSAIQWVLVGGGMELDKLRTRALTMNLNNLVFLPQLPMSKIGAVLNAADALLVHLRNDPLFEITIPSKIQAYLCAGKPLLLAVQGDAAQLVEEAGAGVTAVSEDAVSIAAAADHLASLSAQERNEMGHRAREYYAENLALKVGVAKFVALFGELIEKSKDHVSAGPSNGTGHQSVSGKDTL